MSHPRVEEVSDSDDEVSDPSEGDIDDFTESDILRAIPSRPKPNPSAIAAPSAQPPLFPNQPQAQQQPQISQDDIKDYQCLYPVYFDAGRSRAEGRRVPSKLAVKNPLAREIANACVALSLQPVYEAHRAHPKDWSNPGRVKIPLKKSAARGHPIKSKHHLYIVVAKFLQEHPTTENSASLRTGIQGMGLTSMGGSSDVYAKGKPWPKPAVPKGWKMGELLPAFSAAMTGGGVSENAFKDMMKEMQGGGGGGMPGMGGMDPNMMNMLAGRRIRKGRNDIA
ncbi:signal recognition particle, SRP19 subunit [Xylariaceae sp. FL1019]|nr:signal recognition particle, SRP19 subunit [Xylariaceae sp. FL1019]